MRDWVALQFNVDFTRIVAQTKFVTIINALILVCLEVFVVKMHSALLTNTLLFVDVKMVLKATHLQDAYRSIIV